MPINSIGEEYGYEDEDDYGEELPMGNMAMIQQMDMSAMGPLQVEDTMLDGADAGNPVVDGGAFGSFAGTDLPAGQHPLEAGAPPQMMGAQAMDPSMMGLPPELLGALGLEGGGAQMGGPSKEDVSEQMRDMLLARAQERSEAAKAFSKMAADYTVGGKTGGY